MPLFHQAFDVVSIEIVDPEFLALRREGTRDYPETGFTRGNNHGGGRVHPEKCS